jgi:acyl dehydratase
MNAGCTVERRADLPAGEPLQLSARLVSIDDNGERALITQELVTGTASAPDALRVEIRAFVPLVRSGKGKEKPRVPEDASEIGLRGLRQGAGLEFALLTGDFNPVHWVAPWARAAGFPRPILQGFGTLAVVAAAVDRVVFSGRTDGWNRLEARFARPVVLPARLHVFARPTDGGLWVGTAPGGPAFLVGGFERA